MQPTVQLELYNIFNSTVELNNALYTFNAVSTWHQRLALVDNNPG